MPDAGAQLALAIFAVQAACILVVARAGYFLGILGATATATATAIFLCIALSAVLYFAAYEPGWQVLLVSALVVSIIVLLPSRPMLVAPKFHWINGRILIGLAGAAVIDWLISPNTISAF